MLLNITTRPQTKNYQRKLEKLEYVARKISDIGHPLRLAIIESLRYHKKLSMDELAGMLNEEKADIQLHLNQLQEKNLIICSREANEEVYRVRDKKFVKILNYIKDSSFFLT